MIERCSFNLCKDIQKVIPGMSLDLSEALRTGLVADTGTEVSYNDIEDPSLIRTRVSDIFDAINERNSIINKELTRIHNENNSVNPEGEQG